MLSVLSYVDSRNNEGRDGPSEALYATALSSE